MVRLSNEERRRAVTLYFKGYSMFRIVEGLQILLHVFYKSTHDWEAEAICVIIVHTEIHMYGSAH